MITAKYEKKPFLVGLKILASCSQSGLLGFTIFFSVLLVSKYLSSIVGSSEVFTVDISDVSLSLIGFVLSFLISFLSQLSQKNEIMNTKNKNMNL